MADYGNGGVLVNTTSNYVNAYTGEQTAFDSVNTMSPQMKTYYNTEALENAKAQAFTLGVSEGIDPFMTLSFMALPVIPTLRITTRGVIDVISQQYI